MINMAFKENLKSKDYLQLSLQLADTVSAKICPLKRNSYDNFTWDSDQDKK